MYLLGMALEISLQGTFFLAINLLLILCFILCPFLVQLLEPVGEDKPIRRAEPAERTDILTLTSVRNSSYCF